MIWQPIETAPKDGTEILTCITGYAPCISSWQTHKGKSRFGSDPEKFADQEHFIQYWDECDYRPTHWMPLPDPPKLPPSKGMELIQREWLRQVDIEGWSISDDAYDDGDLLKAGIVYVKTGGLDQQAEIKKIIPEYITDEWPFVKDSFNPSNHPIRNMVIGCAFIIAEIDRRIRLEAREGR